MIPTLTGTSIHPPAHAPGWKNKRTAKKKSSKRIVRKKGKR